MIASSTAAAGCNLWSYVLPDDPSAEEGAEENSDYVEQHGGW